jgi:hypothetical protein
MDDLTNYVVVITNAWTDYDVRKRVIASDVQFHHLNTTPTLWPLTNGFRIIGPFSTPSDASGPNGSYRSNFVVAHFRASAERPTRNFQDNQLAQMGPSPRGLEITIFGSPVSGSVTNNAWDQSWARRHHHAIYASHCTTSKISDSVPLAGSPGGKIANTGRQCFSSKPHGDQDIRAGSS